MNVAMDGLQGERMREMLGAMNQETHGASFYGNSFTIWTVRKPLQ